jgi:protein-disulfide isomerase
LPIREPWYTGHILIKLHMEPTSSKNSIAVPIAIVFGFGLIAAAIYFSGMGNAPAPAPVTTGGETIPTINAEVNISPVAITDYIKGNPNAPILIVEYSDYDCPFCKVFHETMNQIMNEYGVTGKVAWVYRQFPIAQLHPNAPRISEAALCVGEIGGNDAFWKFSDLVFEERETNEATNVTRLPEFAVTAGVERADFISCLESGRMKEKVAASVAEGAGAGIQGTPQSFVLIGNQQAPIEGAQPYEVVKQIVENLLGQLEGTTPATN